MWLQQYCRWYEVHILLVRAVWNGLYIGLKLVIGVVSFDVLWKKLGFEGTQNLMERHCCTNWLSPLGNHSHRGCSSCEYCFAVADLFWSLCCTVSPRTIFKKWSYCRMLRYCFILLCSPIVIHPSTSTRWKMTIWFACSLLLHLFLLVEMTESPLSRKHTHVLHRGAVRGAEVGQHHEALWSWPWSWCTVLNPEG